VSLLVGAALGFMSGLTGIGGGIYLSPLLFMTGWGTARQIAATASFFILVNSMAGLAGQFSKSGLAIPLTVLLPLALAVMAGGWLGSGFATRRFSYLLIRRVTASLIFFVSIHLLWRWAHVMGVSS
jgi:uncharacterized membrane protein YfcA